MANNHGKCPHCGVDLNGGSIWNHFFKEFTEGLGYWMDENGQYMNGKRRILSSEEAAIAADTVASSYGATRTNGQWERAIAIYSMEEDRTTGFQCPDCQKTWGRTNG